MKIINLIEDTPGDEGFLFEHGLSLYIETARHKMLLDTGASDAFITNARRRGIRLEDIDTVVISHGHYDHTGGLLSFAKINKNAKIYIQNSAKGEFFSIKGESPKYIGMHPDITELEQVVFLNGGAVIDEGISIFTSACGRRLWPLGNLLLRERKGAELTQDEFIHEQYLAVSEGGREVLLSGCAHNGILNILERYVQLYGRLPDEVISGFHTIKPEYTDEDNKIIESIASELATYNTHFYSGHCTGEYPMELLSRIMGDRLTVIHSGDIIL